MSCKKFNSNGRPKSRGGKLVKNKISAKIEFLKSKVMNPNHFFELKRSVQEFQDNHPEISLDNAFVGWFLGAFYVKNEDEAMSALMGGARDKGIDAIYVDHESKSVFVVQGKYHQGPQTNNEHRSDIIALGHLGETLLLEKKDRFDRLLAEADVVVKEVLNKVRKEIQKNSYRLILQFITTGNVSETHRREAEEMIAGYQNVNFQVFSRKDLLCLMQDYLEGAAPPVPAIDIPINEGQLFGRFDESMKISSWIFSVCGNEVARIFNEVGIRLFSRNIRGFLGSTSINKEMQETLNKEPELFWYFNNGITIICDEAKQVTEQGRTYIRATNAQIINGQQTTRVLAEVRENKNAFVMVKIIELLRETEEAHSRYTKIVSQIVRATNHQNAISAPDLKANDQEQVRIEKGLRKLKYEYVRKRQTKQEARLASGMRYSYVINKEDLAQKAAACVLGPHEVRLGKNKLFEDNFYLKIFNGRPIFEYLLFYWLGRTVGGFIKKDIRRGYAKWLVLHYIWEKIGDELRKAENREKFVRIAERYYRYEKQFKPLNRAIEETFKASLSLFRENKYPSEGGLLDASTFFNKSDLPQKFDKFLNKNKKYKIAIKKYNTHFLKYLREVEI